MTPQVSVIVPVRNGARWLRDAIDSVTAQTFRDFELLIVDDGSTDETPRMLSELAARDDRVVIIQQGALGLAIALNRGFAEARGPLIARLDADDRAFPERLDRQMRHLAMHPEIGLLGSWAQLIDDNSKSIGQLKPETDPEKLAGILTRTNPFVHSSVMLRVEIARRLGGYRSFFQAAEDYDLWLRFSEVTKVANLAETLVQYRRHGRNVTRRDAIRQAFSVGLALRSAKARRHGGADPAADLKNPPDWRSELPSFCAEDAALYRLLDLADPSVATDDIVAETDFTPLLDRVAELSHAECKLATLAMVRHMKLAPRSRAASTMKVLLGLLRRRPGMTLPLIAALRQK
jgi:glycosyltransferase involved in cell wall biosynthesis